MIVGEERKEGRKEGSERRESREIQASWRQPAIFKGSLILRNVAELRMRKSLRRVGYEIELDGCRI